ncbi:MAG: nicotinate-nucleotide adenylyltransferase [Paracoccus sp. (in: a-proteobacteria)]
MRHGYPLALPGQRIGLLGGSFDPAHDGHLRLSEEALKRLRLDRVWWLVTPGNPLKAHQPAPMAERIAFARSLITDPRIVVTGIEARLGTRKTIDTVTALQRDCPGVHFVWLMGTDNMVQFSQWARWREIAARIPMAVMARPGSRLKARVSKAAQVLADDRLPESQAARLATTPPPAWVQIEMPMSKTSSSAIRAARQGAAKKA